MRIVMLGPFGLSPKATMLRRALPAARALARRGHAVTLIMPPWHTPAEAGRGWDDAVGGVRIEYVSLGGLGLPGAGHGVVAARMARRALALGADVVHSFKPKAYSGLADAILHAHPRRPALVVDTDDWEGPGGWNDLEPYSAAQRWLFARQERWGLGHADAVTVASRTLQTLVWAMGVPPDRVTYLPNAVDRATELESAALGRPTEVIDHVDLGPGHGPGSVVVDLRPPLVLGTELDAAPESTLDPGPRLLLYTRFFEFDLDRPLAVLDRVRRGWPGARLVVGGRGLFGEEERFMALARSRGLADAVDYRGWIAPDDAPALFAAADIALYPFDDTLVNRTKSAFKLLELMHAGLPVVAEAVGQNAEVIVDGVSGRLVPSGDVDAFAAAVAGLAADPAALRAMGAAARARVESDFSWDRRVVDLEAAYGRALAARR